MEGKKRWKKMRLRTPVSLSALVVRQDSEVDRTTFQHVVDRGGIGEDIEAVVLWLGLTAFHITGRDGFVNFGDCRVEETRTRNDPPENEETT